MSLLPDLLHGRQAEAPVSGAFNETLDEPGDFDGRPLVDRPTASGHTWEFIALDETYVAPAHLQRASGSTVGRLDPPDAGGTTSGGWWFDTGDHDHYVDCDWQTAVAWGNVNVGLALGFDAPNKASQRFLAAMPHPSGLELGYFYVSGGIWAYAVGGVVVSMTVPQTVRLALSRTNIGQGDAVSRLTATPLDQPGNAAHYDYSWGTAQQGTRAGFVYGYRWTLNPGRFGPVRINPGGAP